MIEKIKLWFKAKWQKIKLWFKAQWSKIKLWFKNKWKQVKALCSKLKNKIFNIFTKK